MIDDPFELNLEQELSEIPAEYQDAFRQALTQELVETEQNRTDTGASLRFIVAETQQGANYEAGRLLSQNRLGLTLFSLPAAAEEEVAFVLANYDVASEEEGRQTAYQVGEPFSLGTAHKFQVSGTQFSHTAEGDIRIVVSGTTDFPAENQSILLSLTTPNEQTTAVPLTTDAGEDWQVAFTLPDETAGLPHLLEFRALPGGELAVVELGDVPYLWSQLQIEITGAWWNSVAEQAAMTVSLHNPGKGSIYLGTEFIQQPIEGGDDYELLGQITPRLPMLINPGETVGIDVSFLPLSAPVQLQIGLDLWEVSGFSSETFSE